MKLLQRSMLFGVALAASIPGTAAASYSTVACVSNYFATNGCPLSHPEYMVDQHANSGGSSFAAGTSWPVQSGNITVSSRGFSAYTTTSGGYNATFMAGGTLEDTVTFFNPSLAYGAAIPVDVTLSLSGAFTAGGSGGTNGGLLPQGGAGMNVGGIAWAAISDSFSMSWGPDYSPHTVALAKTLSTTAYNGVETGFFVRFDIGSTASADWYSTAGFTGNIYLAPLANGVSVLSASGYDYSAPAVPEPETYAMMMAGLGLLGFLRRRRRPGNE